jgi:hypothetical protein
MRFTEPVRDRELIEVQAAYQNAVEDALVHQVQDLQTLLAVSHHRFCTHARTHTCGHSRS